MLLMLLRVWTDIFIKDTPTLNMIKAFLMLAFLK